MSQPPPLVSPPPLGPGNPIVAPRTSGLAIASLICGILPVPLIGGILAIVFSIKARREIARSQGTLTGQGLALAGMICGIIIGGISLIAMLAGIAMPVIIAQQKKGDRMVALVNAKSIGLALCNFEQEYGTFPSMGADGTASQVQENNPNSGYTFGSQFSNDYFRQLIASGQTDSERIFYAKAPYTKKPDNNLNGDQCLAAGEVGFSYLTATGNESLSSAGNPQRPLIVAATLNTQADGSFDPHVFSGTAVVLRIDQSATTMMIRKSDKKLLIDKDHTLLETGDDTIWGTQETPVIHPPLPLPRTTHLAR